MIRRIAGESGEVYERGIGPITSGLYHAFVVEHESAILRLLVYRCRREKAEFSLNPANLKPYSDGLIRVVLAFRSRHAHTQASIMVSAFVERLKRSGKRHPASPPMSLTGLILTRRNIMSKLQRSNKEGKKQALLTPKEKKAAKRLKKHAGDPTPFIVK